MSKLIVANWKMNLTVSAAVDLAQKIVGIKTTNDVVLCPSFVHLHAVKKVLSGSKVALGAQNCAAFENGPYTGETSAQMLLDIGCEYALIGHSERRQHLSETNKTVTQKMELAQKIGLNTIICVGEGREVYESNNTRDFIEKQIRESLYNKTNATIAYEPIWSIGTGHIPTTAEIQEVIEFIKNLTQFKFKVLYGGSVNSTNVNELAQIPSVDGFLVGGASLKAEEFKIIMGS